MEAIREVRISLRRDTVVLIGRNGKHATIHGVFTYTFADWQAALEAIQ